MIILMRLRTGNGTVLHRTQRLEAVIIKSKIMLILNSFVPGKTEEFASDKTLGNR